MDLSKIPIERVFYFVAGVIPGSAVLLVFHLAKPGRFRFFLLNQSLGYTTKIVLVLTIALVIGNSMTVFLDRFLGMLGGAVGGAKGEQLLKPSNTEVAAPWRDAEWRRLVKRDLGDQAPDEAPFVSQWLFEERQKLIRMLPAEQQTQAMMNLNAEKLEGDGNDLRWEQWYNHYHQRILSPPEPTFEWHVQHGFNFNLQTTSVYLLASAVNLPALRHWWLVAPLLTWVLLLIAESYGTWKRFTDRWSTLQNQIELLSRKTTV